MSEEIRALLDMVETNGSRMLRDSSAKKQFREMVRGPSVQRAPDFAPRSLPQWTIHTEAELNQMVRDGATWSKLAVHFGCSASCCYSANIRHEKRLGIVHVKRAGRGSPTLWTEENTKEALKMRKAGKLIREIAAALGSNRTTVHDKLMEAGFTKKRRCR